jgi:3-hydroxybutyryl-CoA dehydratase
MNEKITIDRISAGDTFAHVFEVTEKKILTFAEATDDRNPLHLDEAFAKASMFKTRVAHGMLAAGFISAVLGTMYPGVGTIYLSQTVKFLKPVYINDRITVKITVMDVMNEKNRLRLETICVNQNNDQVLIGEAMVMPPT